MCRPGIIVVTCHNIVDIQEPFEGQFADKKDSEMASDAFDGEEISHRLRLA
jgi:hypothetical protein